MNFKDFQGQSAGAVIGAILVTIVNWFISAGFIWWGWNTFARHFNLPQFTYMEIFAMRMAVGGIMKVFWQRI